MNSFKEVVNNAIIIHHKERAHVLKKWLDNSVITIKKQIEVFPQKDFKVEIQRISQEFQAQINVLNHRTLRQLEQFMENKKGQTIRQLEKTLL